MRDFEISFIGTSISGLKCAMNIAADNPDITIAIFSKIQNEREISSIENLGEHVSSICQKKQNSNVEFQHLTPVKNGFSKKEKTELLFNSICEEHVSKPKLLEKIKSFKNVCIFYNYHVVELNSIEGHPNEILAITVYSESDNQLYEVKSSCYVLATEGVRNLFNNATLLGNAFGDGIGLAIRAGAEVKALEKLTYYPLQVDVETAREPLLLPPVILKSDLRFYNHDQELLEDLNQRFALDDNFILTLRTLSKQGKTYVDLRKLSNAGHEQELELFHEQLELLGFDPSTELIPVTPSLNGSQGGVFVNDFGQTNINNLFGMNECAYHGKAISLKKIHVAIMDEVNRSLITPVSNVLEMEKGYPLKERILRDKLNELVKLMTEFANTDGDEMALKMIDFRLEILEIESNEIFETYRLSSKLILFRNAILTARKMVGSKINKKKETPVFSE